MKIFRISRALLANYLAILAVAGLSFALSQPVQAATLPPTLISPASSSGNAALLLQYELPEAPTTGTVSLSFFDGEDTIALTMSDSQSVSAVVNLDNLALTANVVSTSAASLADGTYTVTLGYQNVAGDPIATDVSTEVLIDTTAPNAPTSFEADQFSNDVLLSWTNPLSDFAAVTVRRSAVSFPASISDGVEVVAGSTDTSVLDTNLEAGTYYYSIFAYDVLGNISVRATAQVEVDLVTLPPTLVAPVSGTHYRSLPIQFMLPESPSAGTISLYIDNGEGDEIRLRFNTDTSVNITVNPLFTPEVVLAEFDSTITEINSVFTDRLLPDGTYSFALSYQDALGNPSTQATATTVVIDTTAPELTINGEANDSVNLGEEYIDLGVTAIDAVDGDLSNEVTVYSNVNTDAVGEYEISYSVTDLAGNTSEVTRVVTVIVPEPVITVAANGKYLKVFVDGELLHKKKIGKKRLASKNYKVAMGNLYQNYTTIAVVVTTKTEAKLVVYRLTSNNQLKKKAVAILPITDRNPVRLKLKPDQRTIVVRVGDDPVSKQIFKLTRKGKLRLVI